LTPGGRWQEEIANGLREAGSFAVFVGPNGIGDWVREELELAKDRAAKDRTFRLFPVLLPGLPDPFDAATLPPFVSTHTWVDLRKGFEEAVRFQLLINAVKGSRSFAARRSHPTLTSACATLPRNGLPPEAVGEGRNIPEVAPLT
jgi:hypothetical protein